MAKLRDPQKEGTKQQDERNPTHVEQNQSDTKDANGSCMSRKRYQFCAWLLVTLGLCIFFTMFFLSIIQKTHNEENYIKNGKAAESQIPVGGDGGRLEKLLRGIKPFRMQEHEGKKSFNTSGRLSLDNLYEKVERNLNCCKEDSCQIACANVADIFTALYNIIKNSLCQPIDVLLLEKQNFPLGILKNNWPTLNISVNEVVIRFNQTTSIKSGAFNTFLFHDTLVLSLYNRNILSIESSALLGFRRLKYLTIQSYMKRLQPNILQPVQDTLLSFKLNSRLNIRGGENLFYGCSLQKLNYLDLSRNIFNDGLSSAFFESTPNLKYLVIKESHIQHIEPDAFETLADKLLFLNLAKNRLTTLAAAIFKPIVVGKHTAVINLAENNWICNCQLLDFIEFYKTYSAEFMNLLYCKSPHHLYGVALEEVDLNVENCLAKENMEKKKSKESSTEDPIAEYTTPMSNKMRMHCAKGSYTSSSLEQISKSKRQVKYVLDYSLNVDVAPPDVQFSLKLITKNNSVKVTIRNPSQSDLVIWFSESKELSALRYSYKNIDYECRIYDNQNLIVGPLQENVTYTFCILSALRNDISSFNCLPLYVPPQLSQEIWISQDNKHLTIGMICLIFLLTILVGAGMAYIGFNTYPDLLESPKKVLAIKKPDHGYVTTISEIEYQKQSALKRHNQSIKRLLLPETPPGDSTLSDWHMSDKDLKRLSSLKSCSTYFEDILPGDYEMPQNYSEECLVERRNVENSYCTAPGSPPPLPKRNSNISNRSTLIL